MRARRVLVRGLGEVCFHTLVEIGTVRVMISFYGPNGPLSPTGILSKMAR